MKNASQLSVWLVSYHPSTNKLNRGASATVPRIVKNARTHLKSSTTPRVQSTHIAPAPWSVYVDVTFASPKGEAIWGDRYGCCKTRTGGGKLLLVLVAVS